MRHETFTCDAKGHATVLAVHHVLLDGSDQRLDLCYDCTAQGLALLLSNLSPAAQHEWRAALLGEA